MREERSNATCEKYIRDVHNFWMFAGNSQVTKERVVAWKKELVEKGYAVRSINSMLASVNSFLGFLGCHDCKVKNIRLQHLYSFYLAFYRRWLYNKYETVSIYVLEKIIWQHNQYYVIRCFQYGDAQENNARLMNYRVK